MKMPYVKMGCGWGWLTLVFQRVFYMQVELEASVQLLESLKFWRQLAQVCK